MTVYVVLTEVEHCRSIALITENSMNARNCLLRLAHDYVHLEEGEEQEIREGKRTWITDEHNFEAEILEHNSECSDAISEDTLLNKA